MDMTITLAGDLRRRWPATQLLREGAAVTLDDLRPVTPREQRTARSVAAEVARWIEWRERATAEGRLDPELARPAGNWRLESPVNDFLDAYQIVAGCEARTLDLLRYYTGCFSGYRLIDFAPMHGLRSADPPPADLSAAISRNLRNEEPYLDLYHRLRTILPQRLLADPPWMLGEVGRNVGGVVVNRDTVRWQMALATLWHTGALGYLAQRAAEEGTAYVVEVGAGYGALCYHLKRLIPALTYVAVDLPESLLFSGIYLSLTMPEHQPALLGPGLPPPARHGISLVPNFLFGGLASQVPRVDLALNFISMGEMTARQVAWYAQGLSAMMRDGGLMFEANDPRPVEGSARAASDLLAQHFAESEPVDWTGIPQTAFEGHQHTARSHVHANRPLAEMITPASERAPFLSDPPAPGSRLMALWRKARSAASRLIWGGKPREGQAGRA
jgi:hypothetical protein